MGRASAVSRRAASTRASNSLGDITRSPVPAGNSFVTSFAGTGTRTTSEPAIAATGIKAIAAASRSFGSARHRPSRVPLQEGETVAMKTRC